MSMEMGGGKGSRSGKSGKRKRFSDEQIKSLEVMFGSESKPEPRTKQQLASDLGLHPRQVSIWFQNRRARLKSKHIERDYNILKASYDSLASKFELLKKENQVLESKVQSLREKLDGSTAGLLHELKGKSTYIFESYDDYETGMTLGDTIIGNSYWLKENDDLSLAEPVDSSLTMSEDSWESNCFFF